MLSASNPKLLAAIALMEGRLGKPPLPQQIGSNVGLSIGEFKRPFSGISTQRLRDITLTSATTPNTQCTFSDRGIEGRRLLLRSAF